MNQKILLLLFCCIAMIGCSRNYVYWDSKNIRMLTTDDVFIQRGNVLGFIEYIAFEDQCSFQNFLLYTKKKYKEMQDIYNVRLEYKYEVETEGWWRRSKTMKVCRYTGLAVKYNHISDK